MKFFFGIILLLSVEYSFSQNITGTWEGNFGGSFMVGNTQKLVVELFLHNDSILTGASHLYYKNNHFEHYTVKGYYNKRDSTINFEEDSIIALKIGRMASKCLGKYQMKLIINDTMMKLHGKWKDKSSASFLFRCTPSAVWLSKKINLEKFVSTNRVTEIQSLIEIDKKDADSIKIEIFDNGEIDNDTISLYHNDKLITERKMISAKALTYYISLAPDNPIAKLKLIAESVGTIPPCTALMIVTTKKKWYEINLKSDFLKNAVVEFFLKE